jgi:hypothetical protein
MEPKGKANDRWTIAFRRKRKGLGPFSIPLARQSVITPTLAVRIYGISEFEPEMP